MVSKASVDVVRGNASGLAAEGVADAFDMLRKSD